MRTARYLIPLFVLFAGCANYGHGHHMPGDDPPPDKCSTTDDCPSTKTCVEGLCKLKDPLPTPDASAPDAADAEGSPDTEGPIIEPEMDGGTDTRGSDGSLGDIGNERTDGGVDGGGSDGRDGSGDTDSRDAGVECHHNDDHCKQKDR